MTIKLDGWKFEADANGHAAEWHDGELRAHVAKFGAAWQAGVWHRPGSTVFLTVSGYGPTVTDAVNTLAHNLGRVRWLVAGPQVPELTAVLSRLADLAAAEEDLRPALEASIAAASGGEK